jgi:hypothetical protein
VIEALLDPADVDADEAETDHRLQASAGWDLAELEAAHAYCLELRRTFPHEGRLRGAVARLESALTRNPPPR